MCNKNLILKVTCIFFLAQFFLFVSAANTPYNKVKTINDWENRYVVDINKEAPHCTMNGVENIIIDGKWDFKYCDDILNAPKDFFEVDFADSSWGKINVPGTWYANGYEKKLYHVSYQQKLMERGKLIPPHAPKKNPVGLYRYKFDVPNSWLDKENYICFNGVKSAFYVWINGNKVGYSQNSFLPAEFNISKYIHAGENLLSVEVLKYSDGAFFETQDMWQQEGILRSVKLVSRPKTHIKDYFIHTELTDNYKNAILNVELHINGKKENNYKVELNILDGEKVVATLNGTTDSDSLKMSKKIYSPKLWSAEKPNLYKAEIVLKDNKGKKIDEVYSQMGFRQTQIIDGIFFLNGKMVKLKGVNRHDFDGKQGTAVPYASYKKDLILMKKLNINCVRTSHYPDDEALYNICDSLGLWVIDEAFEAINPKKMLGVFAVNSKDWYYVTSKRLEGMIKRDRNHPSVACWSLANESGQNKNNNWIKLHDYAHLLDSTRPVEYDNSYEKDDYAADYDTRMYPSVDWMKNWFKEKNPKKPLFMLEYGHSRGNSLGNMKEYWEYIESEPRCMGGCIWEWMSHAFSSIDENGNLRYLDRSEMDADYENLTDPLAEHCINGMVQPDWSLKPCCYDLKYAHQWIKINPIDFMKNEFQLRNTYKFTNTDDMDVKWQLFKNGLAVENGLIHVLCEPESQIEFKLPIKTLIFDKENKDIKDEYFILFTTSLTKEQSYAKPGHIIALTQIAYPFSDFGTKFGTESHEKLAKASLNLEKLKVKKDKKNISISNDKIDVIFDRENANIIYLKCGNTNLLDGENAGPKLNVYRALIDNDKSKNGVYMDWNSRGLDSLKVVSADLDLIKKSKNEVLVRASYLYAGKDSVRFNHVIEYDIYANGTIKFINDVKSSGLGDLFSLPRVGIEMKINKNIDKFTWYGAGPDNNWDDRCLATPVGKYTSSLSDLWFKYIRPQEASNRSNVRYLDLGKNIHISSDSIFSFTAHPYEDLQIVNTNRQDMLKECPYVVLSLDYRMMGTGCGSMGAKRMDLALPKYRILPGNYHFTFQINPKN